MRHGSIMLSEYKCIHSQSQAVILQIYSVLMVHGVVGERTA